MESETTWICSCRSSRRSACKQIFRGSGGWEGFKSAQASHRRCSLLGLTPATCPIRRLRVRLVIEAIVNWMRPKFPVLTVGMGVRSRVIKLLFSPTIFSCHISGVRCTCLARGSKSVAIAGVGQESVYTKWTLRCEHATPRFPFSHGIIDAQSLVRWRRPQNRSL